MQKAEFYLFQTVCGARKIIVGNMGLTFSGSPNHIYLPKTPCQKVTRTIVCHYCGPVVVVLWCYCSVKGKMLFCKQSRIPSFSNSLWTGKKSLYAM